MRRQKRAADHQTRSDGGKPLLDGRPGQELLSGVFSKETKTGQHVVDAAQPIETHLPQTAADGIPHDQRPTDDRRSGNDRRDDGQIRRQ